MCTCSILGLHSVKVHIFLIGQHPYKMCLGKECSSHVYTFTSCPGMSSGVKHAKITHESYKFGVRKSLGFVAGRNLTNSCSHILQTLNFGYVAYVELEGRSLLIFRIPECWLGVASRGGRPLTKQRQPGKPLECQTGPEKKFLSSQVVGQLCFWKGDGSVMACWEAASFGEQRASATPALLEPSLLPGDFSIPSDDWNKKRPVKFLSTIF